MMEWLRLYHEFSRDSKWLAVARIAGVPTPLVVSVTVDLLIEASRAKDRGAVHGFDPDELSAYLSVPSEQVQAVLDALVSKGWLTADGRIASWDRRQPKREEAEAGGALSSAERSRRHRKRQRDAAGRDATPGDDAGRPGTTRDAPEEEGEEEGETSKQPPENGDGQTCDPVALGREALRALGCDPDGVEANGGSYAPVRRWLAEGITPAEIMAVFQRRTDLADKRNPVAYAAKLMGDEVAKLRAEERVASGWHPPNPDQQRALWRARLEGFCRNGVWPQNIGPDPDSPHCDAPRDLIAEVRSEYGEGGS